MGRLIVVLLVVASGCARGTEPSGRSGRPETVHAPGLGGRQVRHPVVRRARFFGGRAGDRIADVATDSSGNIYVAGSTNSGDLPTRNAAQKRYAGSDAFVAKFDPSGRRLLYATFLGGPCGPGGDRDDAESIAVDAAGNAYVAGTTSSHAFPTTDGTLKPELSRKDRSDAFVAKLGPSGTVEYSTYLGGSVGLGGIGGNLTGDDFGEGIAVDEWGNAFVTGHTDATDFPLVNAVQSAPAGGYDTFLTKIDPTGSRVLFSTYLGGETDDSGSAVAVAPGGAVFVAGDTDSETFPTTTGAFQSEAADSANDDAFVAKLAIGPGGGQYPIYRGGIEYSTYLGGIGGEDLEDVAVNAHGSATVAGNTSATDFPVTPGAFQTRLRGGDDAFVTRLSPAGDRLELSTYLGGELDDSISGIAGGGRDHTYVVGGTRSHRFPLRRPVERRTARGPEMFAARLSSRGNALTWSTYLGGGGSSMFALDLATAVAVRGRYIVVSGFTSAAQLRCCRATAPRQGVDGVLVTIGGNRDAKRAPRPGALFETPREARGYFSMSTPTRLPYSVHEPS